MWLQSIIAVLEKLSTLRELKQAQAVITKTGVANHTLLLAKLITFSALSSSGSLQYARAILDETPAKNSFLCNTMIRAYAHSAFPIKAIHLYNQMHSIMDVKTDSFTYPFVLKACTKVDIDDKNENENLSLFIFGKKGAEIHGSIVRLGHFGDTFVQNSLVHMYSQFGFLDVARRIFDEMSGKPVASWNTMVAAYDRVNDFESANSLLTLMPEKNVVSWNTQIARFIKLCDMKAAREVFEKIPEKDSVSWNSMIAGYIQRKDYREALEFFRRMRITGVEVTEITLISVLGLCAVTGALVIGKEIHDFMKDKQFKVEGFLGNALVDMYAKCGSLNCALDVFNRMRLKHVSCWNSIIMALAVHNKTEEALKLFSTMESNKHGHEAVPNRITFIAVLIACSHKGLIDEGNRYFHLMIEKYKIKPDMKHFGCMVDLFSRWGLLDEARHVIETMPFQANSVIWRTLLGACRIYKNVKLGEKAFRKICELEPFPTDGDRVLLSNIYAELGRWEDVELLRNEMINMGVCKKPGSSHIEVK